MRGEINMHTTDLPSLETDAEVLKYHWEKSLFNFLHATEMTSSANGSETGQEQSALKTKAQGWGSTITPINQPQVT